MHEAWNGAAPAGMPPTDALGSAPRVSALEAVRFVFRAPDWSTNLLMGSVFLLIPIAGPIVLAGYLCEVHQRLARRHPQPLPKLDFSDFGHYLSRGVAPFIVGLVVMMPVMLIAYGVLGGAVFAGIFVARAMDDVVLGVLVGIGGSLLAMLLWVLMSVLLNAAQTRAELTEDFAQALSLSELFSYARSTYKLALVKTVTFGFVGAGIVVLGLLACYVGLYPALAILHIAGTHLRFRIFESYLARGGPPIAVRPAVWLPSEARLVPHYGGY